MTSLRNLLNAFAGGLAWASGLAAALLSIYWGLTGDSPAELLVNISTTVRVVAESPLDTLDTATLNEIVQRCAARPECP